MIKHPRDRAHVGDGRSNDFSARRQLQGAQRNVNRGRAARTGNAMFAAIHRGEPFLELTDLGAGEIKEGVAVDHFRKIALLQFPMPFA